LLRRRAPPEHPSVTRQRLLLARVFTRSVRWAAAPAAQRWIWG